MNPIESHVNIESNDILVRVDSGDGRDFYSISGIEMQTRVAYYKHLRTAPEYFDLLHLKRDMEVEVDRLPKDFSITFVTWIFEETGEDKNSYINTFPLNTIFLSASGTPNKSKNPLLEEDAVETFHF